MGFGSRLKKAFRKVEKTVRRTVDPIEKEVSRSFDKTVKEVVGRGLGAESAAEEILRTKNKVKDELHRIGEKIDKEYHRHPERYAGAILALVTAGTFLALAPAGGVAGGLQTAALVDGSGKLIGTVAGSASAATGGTAATVGAAAGTASTGGVISTITTAAKTVGSTIAGSAKVAAGKAVTGAIMGLGTMAINNLVKSNGEKVTEEEVAAFNNGLDLLQADLGPRLEKPKDDSDFSTSPPFFKRGEEPQKMSFTVASVILGSIVAGVFLLFKLFKVFKKGR